MKNVEERAVDKAESVEWDRYETALIRLQIRVTYIQVSRIPVVDHV